MLWRFNKPMPCVECKYYLSPKADRPVDFARCSALSTFANVAHKYHCHGKKYFKPLDKRT